MSMVIVEPPPKGGQVPLLKHAVMQWLQKAHRDQGGKIHGNSYNICADTRASTANVARALWDLQKQGLVTFRERKNAGADGHGATTVLTHFVLTPLGLKWDANDAREADFATLGSLKEADLNPAVVEEIATDDIARDIVVQKMAHDLSTLTPANALASVLRRVGPLPVKEMNVLLGYNRDSTALYHLTKSYPDAFRIEKGKIRFVGAPDWVAPPTAGGRERIPQNVPGTTHKRRQAEAHLQQHSPHPTPVVVKPVPDAVVEQKALDAAAAGVKILHEVVVGPGIEALLAREGRRTKLAVAIAALEAAGLEEDALSLIDRIPDDTDLEREVIALCKSIGVTR